MLFIAYKNLYSIRVQANKCNINIVADGPFSSYIIYGENYREELFSVSEELFLRGIKLGKTWNQYYPI